MYKIIAISDTHVNSTGLLQILPAELVMLIKGADIVIHAGDFVSKTAYEELADVCKLEAVHGNMDNPALRKILPERKLIEIEGKKIGIIHQAALSIQDMTGVHYMAKEMGADILIFGHFHKPIIERSDVLIACPGSPTSPRLSDPCAIELCIENKTVSINVIKLEETKCASLKSARDFNVQHQNQQF